MIQDEESVRDQFVNILMLLVQYTTFLQYIHSIARRKYRGIQYMKVPWYYDVIHQSFFLSRKKSQFLSVYLPKSLQCSLKYHRNTGVY